MLEPNMERYPEGDVDLLSLQQAAQAASMPPKFRSYYRRLHHRAAIAAMKSLIIANPDHNTTAVSIQAVEFADALVKELKRTETPNDDEED